MREVLAVAVAGALLGACGQASPEAGRDRSGITGRVLLGPRCPVETVTESCDDEPAVGVEVTVAEQPPGEAYVTGRVVARTTTDADGAYRVSVPPGTYVVTAEAGMSCELMDARVEPDGYSTVEIPCDTGIR
ncbi:carboxypeptidase-like regulatory domain-containing protein [Nocardioides stalactiti]|uniref:carboxypeptidase-like regulatory domain-containing protein n=1 Tax=Nocardioides stalactiti TaxID=2755356 RepID=UPI0016004FB3|nr:carboxypeptidase-like regulatory domain-containing protein [Nocardioides stalactiti]